MKGGGWAVIVKIILPRIDIPEGIINYKSLNAKLRASIRRVPT